MRTSFVKTLILFFVSFWISGCCHQSESFFKPLPSQFQKLDKGLEIFIAEDHELPTAQLFFYLRGGSVYDPPGKEGLSAIAMQALRLGGSASHSPTEVEDLLEFVGASLEVSSSPEFETLQVALQKKDLDLGLGLLFDLLKNPRFDPEQFAIIKKRAREAILREREDPMTLANREFPSLVYGEKSSWGRKPTVASIDAIHLEDVRQFYGRFIHPDLMLGAAAGDFGVSELVQKINHETQNWISKGLPSAALEQVPESFESKTKTIPRKGLTQSTLFIGHLGAKRDNPDKFALQVLNYILGGGGALTSRMGEEIRSNAGKAYVVYSDFGFGKEAGVFRMIAQTSLENTDWVLQKMKSMVEQIQNDPKFTTAELTQAKSALLRSLFFSYETSFAQVKELARFHLLGYPDNYFAILQKQIAAVSIKDLERVAKKYFHPEGLKVLVVTQE